MRAIVQTKYGTADTLTVGEIDRPSIEAGEVLVEVRAAALDRGTWHLMAGMPYAMRLVSGLRAPKRVVPGLDVAGVVVAVGSGVTRFGAGDEVFGISKGSFAEYAPAREDKLAHKPTKLTFEQAAAMPVSGLTALQGLCDVGRLEAGQKVLIIGASGGVGTYAVQIAKALGAHVTGVCSTGKVDLVRSIGADNVIDYTATTSPAVTSFTTLFSTLAATHRSHDSEARSLLTAPLSSSAARVGADGSGSAANSALSRCRRSSDSDCGRSSSRSITPASSGSTNSPRTINSSR